jgi:hypothetical protein
MLCKINATLGGATDEKARAINFLRAIQAICTAPEGSTPSVASITAPTESPTIGVNNSVDVITEVISNEEAGGWTSSASTTVTSNYNANLSVPYLVDLHRDSGKATYPFQKLSFRTNPNQMFNGSYTTYPMIGVSMGYNTESTATGAYTLQWEGMSAGGVSNRYRADVNFWSLATQNNNGFRPAAGEWLIASTGNYFIALSGALGNIGLPGTMMYVGLRTTDAWEEQYADNPPLVSVVYDGGAGYTTGTGVNALMWARTRQLTGVINSLPAWYRIENTATNSLAITPAANGQSISPLSGLNLAIWQAFQIQDSNLLWANEMQLPMLPGAGGLMRSNYRQTTNITGPVADPVTGTLVPPAFPITFARHKHNSSTSGGTAIGIYKSMGGPDEFMQEYYTPGQTFVVNNEAYYAYAIGNDTLHRDLFLIRKY